MSRDLDTNTITDINASIVNPFFAVELLFDGDRVLRLWTGVGTLVSDDDKEWVGSGNFLNISSVEETAEMAVKGATLTLSGVPSEVLSLALTEPYQGRVCKLYFGTQSDTAVFNEVFSGYMDQMNIEEGPSGSTIELKVENKLIDLERARVARYSSGYQITRVQGLLITRRISSHPSSFQVNQLVLYFEFYCRAARAFLNVHLIHVAREYLVKACCSILQVNSTTIL